MGLIIVRILLGKSQEIFSIYTLITVGIGVGIMLKELLRIAMVPRLSAAMSGKNTEFQAVFTSSIIASTGLSIFGVIIMLIFLFNIHHFAVTPEQLFPTQVFILCRAFQIFISVTLAPFITLLPVMRKYVFSNIFLTLERAAEFSAILVAMFLIDTSDTQALIFIGLLGTAFLTILYIFTMFIIIRSDKKFRIKFSEKIWPEIQGTTRFIGWTAVLVLTVNFFLRFDIIWINISAGVFGTAVFGIVVQSIGMIRQLTYGIIQGLDSAFAFLTFSDGNKIAAFKKLLYVSSYLQGVIGFACYGTIVFVGHQLLQIWLGPQAVKSGIVDAAYHLILICGAGILVSSFAEVWTNAMNGKGDISQYAPWLIPGALLNPILLILSTFFLSAVPSYEIAAWLYLLLLFVTNAIFLPRVMSKVYDVTILELFTPFKVPLIVILLSSLMISSILYLFNLNDMAKIILVLFMFILSSTVSLFFLYKNASHDFS